MTGFFNYNWNFDANETWNSKSDDNTVVWYRGGKSFVGRGLN